MWMLWYCLFYLVKDLSFSSTTESSLISPPPGFTLVYISAIDLFLPLWILTLFKHLPVILSLHPWAECVLHQPEDCLFNLSAFFHISDSSSNTRYNLSVRMFPAVNHTVKLFDQSVKQKEAVNINRSGTWLYDSQPSSMSHRLPPRKTLTCYMLYCWRMNTSTQYYDLFTKIILAASKHF